MLASRTGFVSAHAPESMSDAVTGRSVPRASSRGSMGGVGAYSSSRRWSSWRSPRWVSPTSSRYSRWHEVEDGVLWGVRAEGVTAIEIARGSAAAEAGIQPGDVLIAVNGDPIDGAGGRGRVPARQPPGHTPLVHAGATWRATGAAGRV